MLVCPQCQFENPDTHNFCQECGTSLVEKPCSNCGTLVTWDAYQCHQCNEITGTIRVAIAAQPLSPLPEFLDLEHRYQVLTGSDTQTLDTQTFGTQMQVLDCQPLRQVSFSNLPELAKPYADLQVHFCGVVPLVLDAWQTEENAFVILEARSHLPRLTDYLRTHAMIPLLQILHWFYEMVDLWEDLEPLRLRQSVLELDNLRLDEDQVLCLQRLHAEAENAPTLQNLGTIWQHLLSQLTQTQSAILHQLLADLQAGTVDTSVELRSRLKAIAYQTQSDSPDAEIMSDPQWYTSNPSDSMSASPDLEDDPSPEQAVTVIPEDSDSDADGDDMPTIVLPMQLFSLEDAGLTDIGRQRNHNEDCFGIETQIYKSQTLSNKVVRGRGLYVLCDGMGGHASGEVASQMAVDSLRNYFKQYWKQADEQNQGAKLPTPDVIREAIQLANKAIYNVNQEGLRSGSGRMGTTLVMLLIQDTEAAVAHVGDSRMYRYTRKRGLEQLTLDHEVGQREITRGVDPEIAYGRPDAYQLTQALGPRDEYFVNPDVQFFELNEDMLLVLASDGLTDNNLLEIHQQTYLDPLLSSRSSLEQGVSKLIELANQENGHDNISAIAVRVKVRPNLDSMRS